MASQYDIKEWQKVMINYITTQLRENTDFFGIVKDQTSHWKPDVRLLDYACGTGNVSKVCIRNFLVLMDGFGFPPIRPEAAKLINIPFPGFRSLRDVMLRHRCLAKHGLHVQWQGIGRGPRSIDVPCRHWQPLRHGTVRRR